MREVVGAGGHETALERVASPWSPSHLIAFRFLFCFLTLYSLDLLGAFFQRQARSITGEYPNPFPTSFTAGLWHHLVPWIGVHVIHLAVPIPFQHEIGQDSPYEYILRGTEVVVALVATLLWTLLDRRRQDYRRLNSWLRVFVRALLSAEMLYYGVAKLIPAQFGVLSLYRLSRPVGELYPMSMLWAFMAASPGYTMLCGAVETLGGLLLLSSRTTMLGAFISGFAMANVLTLNIFYDVNQKIRCVYYLLLALYLLAPQVPALWDLFLRKRPALPVLEPAYSETLWVRRTLAAVPLLYALLLLSKSIPSTVYRYHLNMQGELRRGAYYGVWDVTQFNVTDPSKPLLTPTLASNMHLPKGRDHWRRLVLDSDNNGYLLMSGSNWDMIDVNEITAQNRLELTDSGDPTWRCDLSVTRQGPDTLKLNGTVNGNPVSALLTRGSLSTVHVLDGPRWISEGRRW